VELSSSQPWPSNHRDELTLSVAVAVDVPLGKQADFKPGPFVPPPEPIDATAPLRQEIDDLRRRVLESEDAVTRAKREAEEHARARESVEQKLAREAEERAIWETLAAESESKTAEIASRLAALQAMAEQAPKAETLELIQRAEEAATKIDLDEAATRTLIDQQLRDAGWDADTENLRFANGVRPAPGKAIAIAEWPTANGPADYALFVGTTCIALVEAKRKRKNVQAAIDLPGPMIEMTATTI
jgi:type I restriction enzyme, R subunit